MKNYLNNKDKRLGDMQNVNKGCLWVSFLVFSYISVLSTNPILSKYAFYNFFNLIKKKG